MPIRCCYNVLINALILIKRSLIVYPLASFKPLQWGHNDRDGVSTHRCLDCMLNRLFRRRSKKTSKLRVTGPCEWKPPVTSGFPSQRASDAKNVSIWLHHHAICYILPLHNETWDVCRKFDVSVVVAFAVNYSLVVGHGREFMYGFLTSVSWNELLLKFRKISLSV